MSKKFQNTKRWYHASPKRFRKGQILSRNGMVFMTESFIPHYTIQKDAIENDWHVYEVSPLGKVWPGSWNDAITTQAEVVRYIGKARGISANNKAISRVKFRGPRRQWSHKNFSRDFNPSLWKMNEW